MTQILDGALLDHPLRPPTDDDRRILREWVEMTDDLAGYVSGRRSDDAAIYRRIVVVQRATRRLLYLVYCQSGAEFWVVTSAVDGEHVGRFPTLRVALDFIRPTPSNGALGTMDAAVRASVPVVHG